MSSNFPVAPPIFYKYERAMRHINADMAPEITTVFLMRTRDIAEVSSNMIKSLIGPHGWEEIVRRCVPEPVFGMVLQKARTSYAGDLKIIQ